jgi:hypothetical protein
MYCFNLLLDKIKCFSSALWTTPALSTSITTGEVCPFGMGELVLPMRWVYCSPYSIGFQLQLVANFA